MKEAVAWGGDHLDEANGEAGGGTVLAVESRSWRVMAGRLTGLGANEWRARRISHAVGIKSPP